MKSKHLIQAILVIIFALLTHEVNSYALADGEICQTDQECMSSCCNNNKDYNVYGTCVATVQDTRCEHRRHLERTWLHCLSGSFILAIILCSYRKYALDKREDQRLEELKISEANKASERLTRKTSMMDEALIRDE